MSTNPATLAREIFQPVQDGSDPPIVDKAKDTLGMSSKAQSGTEPVNGELGEGTVAQPYDQGNQEGEFPFPMLWGTKGVGRTQVGVLWKTRSSANDFGRAEDRRRDEAGWLMKIQVNQARRRMSLEVKAQEGLKGETQMRVGADSRVKEFRNGLKNLLVRAAVMVHFALGGRCRGGGS
ncbi:MAG: hypothetical protein Q9209_002375 [Squamulea sp. 1 TL-2023]